MRNIDPVFNNNEHIATEILMKNGCTLNEAKRLLNPNVYASFVIDTPASFVDMIRLENSVPVLIGQGFDEEEIPYVIAYALNACNVESWEELLEKLEKGDNTPLFDGNICGGMYNDTPYVLTIIR